MESGYTELLEVIEDERANELNPVPGDSLDATDAKVRQLAKRSRGQIEVCNLARLAAISDGKCDSLALVCKQVGQPMDRWLGTSQLTSCRYSAATDWVVIRVPALIPAGWGKMITANIDAIGK